MHVPSTNGEFSRSDARGVVYGAGNPFPESDLWQDLSAHRRQGDVRRLGPHVLMEITQTTENRGFLSLCLGTFPQNKQMEAQLPECT